MRSVPHLPNFLRDLDPGPAHSLSLLFSLQEMLHSFEIFEAFVRGAKALKDDDSFPEALERLARDAQKFFFFQVENPLMQQGGSLDKLCFYFDILLQASLVEIEEIPVVLEEMRSLSLGFKSSLVKWRKATPLAGIAKEKLLMFAGSVQKKLQAFFRLLTPLFYEMRSNENVLMYLIEKREVLNRFLGEATIDFLLQDLFPSGQDELLATLSQGFGERGFSHIVEEALPQIGTIDWEVSCYTAAALR